MKRIIVSVTNDLTTDQRIHRVCSTLKQMNFDVLLIGFRLKTSDPINRSYKTFRFNLWFKKGILFYAEYNLRLLFKLFSLKKDIVLANDLDTLLANYVCSTICNIHLVYDSHELFTELPELIDRPVTKNIWGSIEKNIVPKIKNCYTVCDSIAKYYNSKYGTYFTSIRNLPNKIITIEKGSFPFNTYNNKIILYQGALNKGRGLELMIETIPHVENALFIIIGRGYLENELKKLVQTSNLEGKVKFISKKNPEDLKKLTALADLGISLEEDLGLNYKFALPNKLFDYIQSQIPVLVSNLPEMKNIIEKYQVGEVVSNRQPKRLAEQIKSILQKEKSYYSKQIDIARKELNWEKESKKLIEIFNNVK